MESTHPDHTVGPFRKSSLSDNSGNCVEVAPTRAGRAVRDSKDPSGPVLHLSSEQWGAFVGSIKAGELS